MDPKKTSDLNPQLKEIYERVMATKVSSYETPIKPNGVIPTTPIPPISTQSQTQSVSEAQNSNIAVQAAVKTNKETPKKHTGINFSQVILITAGVVFFFAYILFWVRFFNVSLPFSLPF